MRSFARTARTVVHEWAVWKLVRSNFVAPDGDEFVRTYIESPGATAIVAFAPNSLGGTDVVLVRQYRPTLDALSLEIPAGMRDIPSEDALVTAKRELREETGLAAMRWDSIGQMRSAPGITDAAIQLFVARDLVDAEHDRHGPEERFMSVERFSLDDALAMIDSGEIDNAMTVVGILRGLRFIRHHP